MKQGSLSEKRRENILGVDGSRPSPVTIRWAEKLGNPLCPYLQRWVIDLHFFSIRLHHWISGDDPRYFHDHPWWFFTFVLWGSYTDVNPDGEIKMRAGSFAFRPALHRHTVRIPKGGCWTLLLTGPKIRRWGFWVGRKFKKSNKYFLEHGTHPCNR